MTPGNYDKYLKTEVNKFEKLNDGVHHYKSFSFRNSSSHLFIIQVLTTKKVSF